MSENTERRYLKWYNKVGYGSGDVAGNVVYSRDFSRGRIHNKAVKKTLSIPSCPNDMAERADINFSGVLQEALKANLNIG